MTRSTPWRAALVVLALVASSTAWSQAPFQPAIVYDAGGKFDKSFNEAAYNGIERFKKESGNAYLDFEIGNDTQREQAFRRMAQKGADPIIGVGFTQASALEKVAREFPKLRFAIIDAVVEAPNVQSVVFKDHEGSFLAGMLATLASKSGKVGFIGGMDVPVIRRFQCGYEQGAKYANPKVEVLSNMTGTTPAAWSDPTRGGELARSQFSRGVDVVFAAAGGTGIGVYQAAKDQGKLAHRRRQQPEPRAPRHHAHVDAQTRRRGGVQHRPRRQRRQLETRHHGAGPEGTRRGPGDGRRQCPAGQRRHAQEAGRGVGRHHRRQDQGRQLHARHRLQVLIAWPPWPSR